MAGIILPHRWTQQPQYPVGIDWGNPLTRGLSCLLNTDGIDVVSNRLPVSITGTVKTPTNSGLVRTYGGSATDKIITNSAVELLSGKTTFILGMCHGSGGGVFGRFMFKGSSATSYSDQCFYDAAGRLAIGQYTNAGAQYIGFPLGALDVPHVYVVTSDCATAGVNPSGVNAYLDGVLQTLLTPSFSSGVVSTETAAKYRIGNRNDDIRVWDGWIGLVGFWNRVLSAAEVKSLSANPWQIFAPIQRRIWVPSAGGDTLSPSLVTNSQTFYAATVSAGAVALAPSLVTNTQTFPAATVTLGGGAQQLTPSLVTNTQSFPAATVTPGVVALNPALLTNNQTFYAPTVAPGAITLTPSLLTNTQTFYGPTVANGAIISPPYFENAQTFYAATVTPGAVSLSPSLHTNSQTFYAPSVGQGTFTQAQLAEILAYVQANLAVPSAVDIAAAVWAKTLP